MSDPWLSVVMPVRNGEDFLDQALQSILVQLENGIEVIVVEGGSTDKTNDILESYINRLPIRLFRSGASDCWTAKSNQGLANARGDFVCFLHHDDLWLGNRLSVLKRLVQQAPDTTMFLHPSWYIDPRGKRVGVWHCPLAHGVEFDSEQVLKRLLVQNFIAMPAPTFSRDQAMRVGGMDESLWYTADWDFWLKLAAAGKTIYHPQALAAYRIHPQAMTMQGSSDINDFRRQQEIVLDRHVGREGAAFSVQPSIQRVARYSIEVNTGLAAMAHGSNSNPFHLLSGFFSLGPAGWYRYLRDSRIVERIISRYRIGLAS